MSEKHLERACMKVLAEQLPGAYLWKIRDETTGGQPDLEVAWGGHTTKIEFKVLKKNETVHDKWEDARQLVTLVRYERATGRCWVVAWRQAHLDEPDATLIYRPTALLDGKCPKPREEFAGVGQGNIWHLGVHGVIQFGGFNHRAIVDLIHLTHATR